MLFLIIWIPGQSMLGRTEHSDVGVEKDGEHSS